jgi:hypothetical protein
VNRVLDPPTSTSLETLSRQKLEWPEEGSDADSISFNSPGHLLREGELWWSKSKRVTARKAFDHALNRELQEVIQQTKQKASAIKEPAELWELESEAPWIPADH